MSELIVPKKELIIPKNYSIYVKPTEYALSIRKIEAYEKFAQIKNYYQRNPVKFIEDILGAKLFDAQAYCVANSWATPYVLWVCSRG